MSRCFLNRKIVVWIEDETTNIIVAIGTRYTPKPASTLDVEKWSFGYILKKVINFLSHFYACRSFSLAPNGLGVGEAWEKTALNRRPA